MSWDLTATNQCSANQAFIVTETQVIFKLRGLQNSRWTNKITKCNLWDVFLHTWCHCEYLGHQDSVIYSVNINSVGPATVSFLCGICLYIILYRLYQVSNVLFEYLSFFTDLFSFPGFSVCLCGGQLAPLQLRSSSLRQQLTFSSLCKC